MLVPLVAKPRPTHCKSGGVLRAVTQRKRAWNKALDQIGVGPKGGCQRRSAMPGQVTQFS